MVRFTIIALLVALHIAYGIPAFMTDGAYLQRALFYSFFHASWWHLAVNGIAAWNIFAPSRKCSEMLLVLLVAFIIAVLVYPLSFRPVIGFSNVLYAVLGLRTPTLSSPWWKRPAVITFLVITVAMIFVPRFSATTHIAAFALGMAGASVKRHWLRLTQDARRYL